MIKKTTSLVICATLSLSSVGYTASSNEKGVYQNIDDGRKILLGKAYRIDKELVASLDEQSNRTYTLNSNSSYTTQGRSGLSKAVGGVAGAVIGGSLGFLASGAFGLGALGTNLATGGAAALGGLVGGVDHGQSGTQNNSNTTTVSESSQRSGRTYQIHKKSDTWGMIALDVEGYQKARAAITNSTLAQNSCVQQGIQFLDEVIQTQKHLNSKDLKNLAESVSQLLELRSKKAIEADQGRSSAKDLDAIDEFLDQRITLVRLNYQDYLTSGTSCALGTDKDNMRKMQQELQKKTLETSVTLTSNSMYEVPQVSFDKLPYKAENKVKANDLKAIGYRQAVSQVLVLKKLKEMNFITFERSKGVVKLGGTPSGGVYLAKVPQALARMQQGSLYDVDVTNVTTSLVGVLGLGTMGTMFSAIMAESDNNRVASDRSSAVGVGSMALIVAAGATGLSANGYKEYKTKKDIDAAMQMLMRDKELNDQLNQNIQYVESVFELNAAQSDYLKNRDSLISTYKTEVAAEIVRQAVEKRGAISEVKASSYGHYLMSKGVLKREEVQELSTLMDFMNSRQLHVNNVDSIQLIEAKVSSLLTIVKSLQKESGYAEHQKELADLEKRLSREVQGLQFLK